MTVPVIVRPVAELDIQDAFNWSEGVEPGLGPRLLSNIDRIVQVLEVQPFAFPLYHRHARRAVIHQSPYILYHVSAPDLVLIVACFSGHRDPRWVKRHLRRRGGA